MDGSVDAVTMMQREEMQSWMHDTTRRLDMLRACETTVVVLVPALRSEHWVCYKHEFHEQMKAQRVGIVLDGVASSVDCHQCCAISLGGVPLKLQTVMGPSSLRGEELVEMTCC